MTVSSTTVGKKWWGKKRKKRDNPEHRLHKAVAQYLALALRPPVFWTSIDHGAGKLSKAAAGMAKARGVKAGLPDVLVFDPQDGLTFVLGIELKSDKGRLSDPQIQTHAKMIDAGAVCTVANSVLGVQQILQAHRIPIHARAS